SSLSRFKLCLLPRRHEERMLLSVFDYFFGHHFALETTQRAFYRFTRVNCYYCHQFSPLSSSNISSTRFHFLFNTAFGIAVKRALKTPRRRSLIRGVSKSEELQTEATARSFL